MRHRWCAFGEVALDERELAALAGPGRGERDRATVRCFDCDGAWPDDGPCTAPRRPGYPRTGGQG